MSLDCFFNRNAGEAVGKILDAKVDAVRYLKNTLIIFLKKLMFSPVFSQVGGTVIAAGDRAVEALGAAAGRVGEVVNAKIETAK